MDAVEEQLGDLNIGSQRSSRNMSGRSLEYFRVILRSDGMYEVATLDKASRRKFSMTFPNQSSTGQTNEERHSNEEIAIHDHMYLVEGIQKVLHDVKTIDTVFLDNIDIRHPRYSYLMETFSGKIKTLSIRRCTFSGLTMSQIRSFLFFIGHRVLVIATDDFFFDKDFTLTHFCLSITNTHCKVEAVHIEQLPQGLPSNPPTNRIPLRFEPEPGLYAYFARLKHVVLHNIDVSAPVVWNLIELLNERQSDGFFLQVLSQQSLEWMRDHLEANEDKFLMANLEGEFVRVEKGRPTGLDAPVRAAEWATPPLKRSRSRALLNKVLSRQDT